LDKDINEMINFLPKQHKVIIHGFVSHKKLIRIMSEETHILLNSTRNMGVDEQSEGYPFKMLEYAATGIPIISSRIGKLDNEFNKLVNFYETENPNEIANVIKYVINNYENCVKNAYMLQSHVLEEYSIPTISRKIGLFIEGISKIK
jgi:glycosyltransferase involved in cell wall biosynthesis